MAKQYVVKFGASDRASDRQRDVTDARFRYKLLPAYPGGPRLELWVANWNGRVVLFEPTTGYIVSSLGCSTPVGAARSGLALLRKRGEAKGWKMAEVLADRIKDWPVLELEDMPDTETPTPTWPNPPPKPTYPGFIHSDAVTQPEPEPEPARSFAEMLKELAELED